MLPLGLGFGCASTSPAQSSQHYKWLHHNCRNTRYEMIQVGWWLLRLILTKPSRPPSAVPSVFAIRAQSRMQDMVRRDYYS